jgi:hypothetical protein
VIAADWVTISALATAGGTLVLALATYASVRSANRAARVAERSLLAGLRPLLISSRLDDPTQKVSFADEHWLEVRGGRGTADVTPEAVYMAMSIRNVGSGIAVLHGWHFSPERRLDGDPPGLEDFIRLTRDLYVPAGDVGFWQGTFRDPSAPAFAAAAEAIAAHQPLTVDVLYGDHEGGQRMISRFGLLPSQGGADWIAAAARHWDIDRESPR